jgi:regulation of enolase protein 1 (concanavalin A-like superfamily)
MGGTLMRYDPSQLFWVNEPTNYSIQHDKIVIHTDPKTDFWQRTYYGFRNDSAPALLFKINEPYFSFIVKTEFDSKTRFDQCGVIIYQNSDNWFKASIEYENETYQRLGSVVTNNGYSDWATTDIESTVQTMYYRLSRRESDFCIENSYDGVEYKQMRIFHLFEGAGEIQMGMYACSPEDSSFESVFSELEITDCKWEAHK